MEKNTGKFKEKLVGKNLGQKMVEKYTEGPKMA